MKVYITEPKKIVGIRLWTGLILIIVPILLSFIVLQDGGPDVDKYRMPFMGMMASGFLIILYNQLANSNKKVGHITFYKDAIAICRNEKTKNIYYKTIDHMIFEINGYEGQVEEPVTLGGTSSMPTFKRADKNKMIIRTKDGTRIETPFYLGSKSTMLRLRNRWRKLEAKQGIKVVLKLDRD